MPRPAGAPKLSAKYAASSGALGKCGLCRGVQAASGGRPQRFTSMPRNGTTRPSTSGSNDHPEVRSKRTLHSDLRGLDDLPHLQGNRTRGWHNRLRHVD